MEAGKLERKIKAVLAYTGHTQGSLAELLGTSGANLQKKIKKETFKQAELEKLAEALGCEWQANFVFPDGKRI